MGDEYMLNASKAMENAIRNVLKGGKVLTPDLGGLSKTEDLINAILAKFRNKYKSALW